MAWRTHGEVLIFSSNPSITYRFEQFELDADRFELRVRGEPTHIEPQVLSLLLLFASNPDRLIGKDEIIEKIWGGRIVSEATVTTRIKSARRALGDDGAQQRFIRTVHKKGYRFLAEVTFVPEQSGGRAPAPPQLAGPREPPTQNIDGRPSIAVLPFRLLSAEGPFSIVADALADELISDLSRLRWLLVIARGSSFRFRHPDTDLRAVGDALNVRYCLSGSVEAHDDSVTILVELARTSDGAVVWAERFTSGANDLAQVRHEIVAAIVANLEIRIPQHEAQLYRGKAEATLDSWSAYHLGIDLMFRFNRADNASAARLFERSLALDQDFGRAWSGLSFTHFQDAFLQYSSDPEAQAEKARAFAEQALRRDPLDPFGHLNLGRSLWLDGAVDESVERLSDAIALSPNYAQAVYSKAWAEMTQCDAASSDGNAALALQLSPLDPLRYAMLGVRSLNALVRGDYENASHWGERAARAPGAHKYIAVIAALGTELAGQRDRASAWMSRAQQQDRSLTSAAFLRSFPFAPSAARELIAATLRDLGI